MTRDVPEPAVYRPFALLAFGGTIVLGTPLGVTMLAWLYGGGDAVPIERVRLHAAVQLFGFFGTLIVGVAHHLLPRFAGRAVSRTRLRPWLVALLAAALVLRTLAVWRESEGAPTAAAAALQAIAFALFGGWVWRVLGAAPLRVLRRHLALASAWLVAACGLESALRWTALASGSPGPAPAGLTVVHAMALAGVIGWVLGVLLRAGPMFVADWRVPPVVAHGIPGLLALAIGLVALPEIAPLEATPAAVLARLGDLVLVWTPLVAVVAGGALRRAPRALPMLSRGAAETRLFRLAVGCAGAAAALAAVTLLLAWRGEPQRLAADAVRHLLAVGVLTSLVVAMTFRLIPVLERTPLRWPRLRAVAFWALLGAVLARTSQVAVGAGGRPLAYAVALSGVLVWIAVAAAGASLVAAIVAPVRGGPAGPRR